MKREQIDQEIKNIVQQLVEKYRPEKIILFGSAVKGKFGSDSDLDFLVIKEDKTRHLKVEQKLHKIINYNIATDFLFLRPKEVAKRLNLGDFFLKEVFEKGKVLYG